MARAGERVDECITSRAGSPGVVASRILDALKAIRGIEVQLAGGNAYRLSRRYRPGWAVVLACATGPLLIGLLFLLVRKEESCLLTISKGPSGTAVRLTGTLLRAAREAIHEASVPAPPAPVPTFLPGSAVVNSVAEAQPARWRLRLRSGQAATIDGLVLIGREPAAAPGERARHLIGVADPGKSVSKTHLALGPDGTGVWLMDRHSTNGTAVVDHTGQRTECPPGTRMTLDPPCRVLFGDLEAELLPA